jgi:hypothetical protein
MKNKNNRLKKALLLLSVGFGVGFSNIATASTSAEEQGCAETLAMCNSGSAYACRFYARTC